jgi:hypothetical protein
MPPRIRQIEWRMHREQVIKLGEAAIWARYADTAWPGSWRPPDS